MVRARASASAAPGGMHRRPWPGNQARCAPQFKRWNSLKRSWGERALREGPLENKYDYRAMRRRRRKAAAMVEEV